MNPVGRDRPMKMKHKRRRPSCWCGKLRCPWYWRADASRGSPTVVRSYDERVRRPMPLTRAAQKCDGCKRIQRGRNCYAGSAVYDNGIPSIMTVPHGTGQEGVATMRFFFYVLSGTKLTRMNVATGIESMIPRRSHLQRLVFPCTSIVLPLR